MVPNLTPAEGFVLGIGAKMFKGAGYVIIYGISASVGYGVMHWIMQKRAVINRPFLHNIGKRSCKNLGTVLKSHWY